MYICMYWQNFTRYFRKYLTTTDKQSDKLFLIDKKIMAYSVCMYVCMYYVCMYVCMCTKQQKLKHCRMLDSSPAKFSKWHR